MNAWKACTRSSLHSLALATAALGGLTACGGGDGSGSGSPNPTATVSPTPSPTASPTPSPTPVATPTNAPSPDLAQNRLLTDAEMRTPELATAPDAPDAAVQWVRNNAFPIRSVTYDQDFSDLQFLQNQIGNHTIVQLGESSHGTREFNQVKTRIIKFLHQEMGFNVVAFESGFFEGVFVDQNRTSMPADQMLRFLFSVWSTDEVYELFQYVEETQSTARPLRIAGFDSQISSRYYSQIFAFIGDQPDSAILTPAFKTDLTDNLRDFQQMQTDYGRSQCSFSVNSTCTAIVAEGRALRDALEANKAVIAPLAQSSDRDLRILYIAVHAAIGQLSHSIASYGSSPNRETRDENMAEILGLVRERLFPNEKIIVWAHNRHIAMEQSETLPVLGRDSYLDRPMGYHLREAYPNDLFTVGLYMLRGVTADNLRRSVNVQPPRPNSLEAIAYGARLAALYIDTSASQPRVPGNAFVFERTEAHVWGGAFGTYSIIPSDQYDGVLMIDNSSLPVYR